MDSYLNESVILQGRGVNGKKYLYVFSNIWGLIDFIGFISLHVGERSPPSVERWARFPDDGVQMPFIEEDFKSYFRSVALCAVPSMCLDQDPRPMKPPGSEAQGLVCASLCPCSGIWPPPAWRRFSSCLIGVSLVATCPFTVSLQEEPGSILSTLYTYVGSGRQHIDAPLLLEGLHQFQSTLSMPSLHWTHRSGLSLCDSFDRILQNNKKSNFGNYLLGHKNVSCELREEENFHWFWYNQLTPKHTAILKSLSWLIAGNAKINPRALLENAQKMLNFHPVFC